MSEIFLINTEFLAFQIDEHEIWKKAGECFSDKGYVYMVLDHTVALGTFEQNSYSLCLDGKNIVHIVSEKYIKEFILFNENQEFRATRSQGKFFCRHCRDVNGGDPVHAMDDICKIWGKAEQIKSLNGWSVLQSKRGSRIYFPENLECGMEMGVRVRRYLRFPAASSNCGLIDFFDERLCGFDKWPMDHRGRKDHGSSETKMVGK